MQLALVKPLPSSGSLGRRRSSSISQCVQRVFSLLLALLDEVCLAAALAYRQKGISLLSSSQAFAFEARACSKT